MDIPYIVLEISNIYYIWYKNQDRKKAEFLLSFQRINTYKNKEKRIKCMSKAILVLDMPGTCCDCNFCREIQEGIEACCELMDEPNDNTLCRIVDSENGYCQEKPNWCPLKELPDETHNDVYMDEYCDGYDDGWNSLRKEILGEDEENK